MLAVEDDVFAVLATGGDTWLGGDDVDLLVAEELAVAFLKEHRWDPRQDRQAFERLRAAAEWVKCTLSVEEDVKVRVADLILGEEGKALDLVVSMRRSLLESMIKPAIERSIRL